jgi:branched-chain amino acid transport system permease protein
MTFVQLLVTGLLVGGTYALLASGLGLIFGVLRIVNFAQADLMMLAMYTGFVLYTVLNLDPFVAAVPVFLIFLFLGMTLHRALLKRVAGRSENHDAQVVLTLGIGLVLQSGVLLAFSATPRLLALPYGREALRLGPLFVDRPRLYAFATAVVVAAALFAFLNRTRTGRAVRAAAGDWEAATYMGIDVMRAYRLAFGIGVGLTAVGGVALSAFQPFSPFIGLDFVVVMFAAVVLGGLGSTTGAFLGGIVIGVVQSVSQLWSPAALANVYVFALFLLILLVRPQGLLGRAKRAI